MATNRELLLKSSLSSMLKGILTTLLHIFLYFILFYFYFYLFNFFYFYFEPYFHYLLLKLSMKIFNAWKKSVFWVFLVRIFQHSDWIRRDTPYLFVFSPNAGKYGPEKLQIPTLFTQCKVVNLGTSSRFLLHFVQ